MAKKCEYTDENGQQCAGFAINGSIYCLSHDPNQKETRVARSKKGGEATSYQKLGLELPAMVIASPADVVGAAVQTINEVRAGQLPPKVASTLGYLLGIVLKAYEVSNLDQRVEMIESILVERRTAIRRR